MKKRRGWNRMIAYVSAVALSVSLFSATGVTGFAAEPAPAAAGSALQPGMSLVAADQEKIWAEQLKAHPYLEGLDITWLDFGPGISGVSLNNSNAFYNPEGVFTLDAWGDNGGTIAIDQEGKVVVGNGHNQVGTFHDGLAVVVDYVFPEGHEWVPGSAPVPPGYRYGVVDRTGKEVIPMGKFGTICSFSEGLACVEDPSGTVRWGYADKTGELAIPYRYAAGKEFSGGLAPVQDAGTQKWGYIDKEGNTVVDFIYEDADSFSEGLARVCAGGKAGYIDSKGEVVIPISLPIELNAEAAAFHEGLAAARSGESGYAYSEDGKLGYIDKTGKFAIEPQFYDAGIFRGGIALCTILNGAAQSGGSVVIDKTGKRLTPIGAYGQFAGEQPEDGLIRLFKTSTYGSSDYAFGAVNRYGTEVVPFAIPEMTSWGNGVCLINTEYGSGTVGILKRTPDMDRDGGNAIIHVVLNGEELLFDDTDAVVENGRTLVPMRAIFEKLGAQVDWDGTTRTVTGTKEGTTVTLKIGETAAKITDTRTDSGPRTETVELDVPAKILGGRTMVPLRFIAESFNAKVDWNQETRTATIDTEAAGV